MMTARDADAAPAPTREDLLAFNDFVDAFEEPDFSAGEWVPATAREDGVVQIGWWSSSPTVDRWEQALYGRNIVDPQSDYLARSNVAFVNEAIADPTILAEISLPRLRKVLTFLVRAERHAGGGWYESAFRSGMAQMATKRLAGHRVE